MPTKPPSPAPSSAGAGRPRSIGANRRSRRGRNERPGSRAPSGGATHTRHRGASVMPFAPSQLQQTLGLLRAVAAGGVGAWLLVVLLPALEYRVDPAPGGFHLVAAHKQGRVALDDIQQQAFVGIPAPLLVEGVGQV